MTSEKNYIVVVSGRYHQTCVVKGRSKADARRKVENWDDAGMQFLDVSHDRGKVSSVELETNTQ